MDINEHINTALKEYKNKDIIYESFSLNDNEVFYRSNNEHGNRGIQIR